MTLMVCVDDAMGMAFNGRRQSRDKAVYGDMAALAAGRPIWMAEGSARLFEGLDCALRSGPDFAAQAQPGQCCFVEFQSLAGLAGRVSALVLYRWNRRYPADLYFDFPLEGWRQSSVTEFAGSSHETITREVYTHEDE